MALDLGIFLLQLFLRFEHQVDQDRPSLTVEGDGVFVIALAQHLFRRDPRHLLDGPVPGDDVTFSVNHQRRIGQEVDDVSQPALRLLGGRVEPRVVQRHGGKLREASSSRSTSSEPKARFDSRAIRQADGAHDLRTGLERHAHDGAHERPAGMYPRGRTRCRNRQRPTARLSARSSLPGPRPDFLREPTIWLRAPTPILHSSSLSPGSNR